MKKESTLKVILSVLVIVLLTLVSGMGVYVKDRNVMKNKLPDYKYGMEIEDTNLILLKIKKDETKANEELEEPKEDGTESEANNENQNQSEENKEENKYTLDNYKKAKKLIEKRLVDAGIQQYTVRLDEASGNIAVELPTTTIVGVVQNIFTKGNFEIKIADNNEVIVTNADIKEIKTSVDDSNSVYGQGSIVKMDIIFTKEATKKLENIKNTYAVTYEEKVQTQTDENSSAETATTQTTSEQGKNEETKQTETKDRQVALYLNGTSLGASFGFKSFIDSAANGSLPLTLGNYTTNKEDIDTSLKQANLNKSLIQNEELPVEYEIEQNSVIHSNVQKNTVKIVFAIVFVAMAVVLLVKYKLKGLYGFLTIVGITAALLLTIRYSNLVITTSAICSIVAVMAIQFIYVYSTLNGKTSHTKFNENIFEFTKIFMPVFIMSLVISFAKTLELGSIGQIIFWGLIIFEIINNTLTRALLADTKNK